MLKARWLLLSGLLIAMTICSPLMAEELTLDDCIKLALEHNKDVIRARSQVTMANNNVWTAVGGFLPSVSVSASLRESHSSKYTLIEPGIDAFVDSTTMIADSFLVTQNENNYGGISKEYSLGGTASLDLFNGGQNIFNYLGAKADKNYYSYIAEESEQNLIYSVKVYYFAYLRSLDRQEIASEAVKRGEEQYKLANSKYEVGSASKSDVLKAKVQYGNDKLELISAENNVKTALADLKYLIGVDIHSKTTVSSVYSPKEYSGTHDEALKYGLSKHPGLLAMQSNVKAAKYDVKSAWGKFLPTWNVSLSKSWGGSTWSDVSKMDKGNSQWTFGSTISLPIFQGFSRKAAISNAKVLLNDARASMNYAENDVALQINESYLDINRSREALKVAEETDLAAQEDMSIVREKYNLGAATILEVLDAQVSLIQAQNSKIQAEFDYNLAVAKLEKAMGTR